MNYLENRNHIQPKRKHFSKELCHHYPLLSNIGLGLWYLASPSTIFQLYICTTIYLTYYIKNVMKDPNLISTSCSHDNNKARSINRK